MNVLVDPAWLDRARGDDTVVVLDCAWHVPESGRDGASEFRAGHVPGARHFDLTSVSDPTSPFANMMPSAQHFAREVERLGVSDDTTVIVYDAGYVAARAWLMFRNFGHDRVAVLDGGLRRWIAEGYLVETGEPAAARTGVFTAVAREGVLASLADVEAALSGGAQVVDARTATRFSGAEPSGYPGVPGGHIPGALNVPWAALMPATNGHRFLEPFDAEAVLRAASVDPDRPVIATCGSGVTAAILAITLERMGRPNWTVYDGSWHEWAQTPGTPRATLERGKDSM